MSSGILVWALHFAAAYGFTGLACARGLAAAVPWVVGAATLAAAAAAALVIVRGASRRAGFEDTVAFSLAAFALVAILFEGASVFWVAPCVSR
jgi:hypothetical protein